MDLDFIVFDGRPVAVERIPAFGSRANEYKSLIPKGNGLSAYTAMSIGTGPDRSFGNWQRLKRRRRKKERKIRYDLSEFALLSIPSYAVSMGSLGAVMAEGAESREKSKKSGWWWPIGVMATGLAGVVLVALRGCWHRRMSWPVRMQGYAYQVCLGCGAKRLFDEERFRAYGPYEYDLNKLIAWSKAAQGEKPALPREERPAS